MFSSIGGIIGGAFSIPNTSAQSPFPNFNFAAVGDWDCGSNAVATRNSVINTNPELVVGLGDYSYEANAGCWLNIVDPFDHKMKIAIGNHEIEESSQSLGQYLSHFNMSRQYHSFNFHNIHFLILATDDSFGTTSSQYSFAVNDLKAASTNSNIDWIVVAFHKPLYDVPCSSDSCDDEDAFRNIYHPLFDQYDVDLALYGHAHNYVRTFPIKHDSSTSDSPIITSTNRNNYVNPDGEIFVQSGAGGRSLRDLSGTTNYNAFQSDSEFGILNIDVVNTNSDNLQLLGKFIQNDGDVIDQFTITKQDTTTPPPAEICNNGADDDGDGKIDSADPDCQTPATGYHYDPFFTATGSNKLDVPNNSTLRLSSFTAATWFKTTANFPDEGVMVNKGGLGSENAGANQNYGIWFTPSERLQGGFENTGGGNRYLTSTNTYNDGQWHHGVVTFDNPNNIVRLFVDGVQIGTLSTTSNPDNTGSQPLRIAGNAQSLTEDFFIGQLDEVGVWNRALTNTEIINLMNTGLFPSSGLVYSNSFGTSASEICNDNIDNDGDGLVDAADPDCQTPPVGLQYCFDFQWGGSEGTGNGQFIRPHDVAFDSAGFVYINDRGRHDIQKFTHDGRFISKFGEEGQDLGQFSHPYSILIDPNDNLYVVDRANDRIQKLTTNGIPLFEVRGFSDPEAMAIDKDGNFFVTDTGADRIIKFDQNFNFISELGSTGDGSGEFEHPHGIGLDSVGNLYVNDAFSPRIQKFTNNGTFIKQWGSLGTGNGQFTLPLEHLEVDSTDKVFMVDSESNPRVQLFDTEGNFITKFGELGSGAGELDVPEMLNVDTQGNVYVVDRGDLTIKVFKQCTALLSSFEGLGLPTTTDDQIFPLLVNSTAEINPLRKSQPPSSDLILKDELSNLPSMIIPLNLQ